MRIPVLKLPVAPPSDWIPDEAIRTSEDDRLHHTEIAVTVADLVEATPTPATIAIFGPWGAGKSSIGNLLRRELARRTGSKLKFVYFDAWKFSEAPLRRHFLARTARVLRKKGPAKKFVEKLYARTSTTELNFTRASLFLLARNAIAVFVGLALLVGSASMLAAAVPTPTVPDYWERLASLLAQALPNLLLSTALLAPLLTAILGPLKTQLDEAEPSGAEQFDDLFNQLISSARGGYVPIVFFIDELDRAPSSAVVSVLQTMRTFLNQRDCIFIVAADQVVLEQSLRDAEPSVPRQANPYYSGGSAYLDKIFHYQFAIPAVQSARMTRYALDLVEGRGGTWMVIGDSRPYVISLLIPDHVRSPRRAKTLLNNFVFAHKVARARAELRSLLDSQAGILQLAKAVCLRTEFPLLYQDIEDEPDLIDALTAMWTDDEDAQERFKTRESLWTLATDHFEGRTRLDIELGSDDETGARLRLSQLRDYLLRTREVPGPGRLMIYLESAADPIGLSPGTADALERAARNADPDAASSAYSALSRTERLAAIEFLSRLARGSLGLEVQNVLRTLVLLAARETDPTVMSQSAALVWRTAAPAGPSLLASGNWGPLSDVIQHGPPSVRSEFEVALSAAAEADREVLREFLGALPVLTVLGKERLRILMGAWLTSEWAAAATETLLLDETGLTEFWEAEPSALTQRLSDAASDADEVQAAVAVLRKIRPAVAWGLVSAVAAEATTATLDLREEEFAALSAPPQKVVQNGVLSLIAAHPTGIRSYAGLISDPVDVSVRLLAAAVSALVSYGSNVGVDGAPVEVGLGKLAPFLEGHPSAVEQAAADLRPVVKVSPTGATAGDELTRRHDLLKVLISSNPNGMSEWLELLARSATAAIATGLPLTEAAEKTLNAAIGMVVKSPTTIPIAALRRLAAALRVPRPATPGSYADSERIFDLIRVARALDAAGERIDVDPEFSAALGGSGSHRSATVAQLVAWKRPNPSNASELVEAAVRAAQIHPYSRTVLEPYFEGLPPSQTRELLRLCFESTMPVPTRVLPLVTRRDEQEWATYLRRQTREAGNAILRLRTLRFITASPPRDQKARLTIARCLADLLVLNQTSFRLAATHLDRALPDGFSPQERKILRKAIKRTEATREALSKRALGVLGQLEQ